MSTPLTASFAHLPTRIFRSGRSILYQGEIPRSAYIVKQGTVRAYDIGRSGDERTISFHTAGDIIPFGWVSGQTPLCLYNYQAYDDIEVYYAERAALLDFIEKDPALMRHLLARTYAAYLGATMHVQALEQSRAQDKLVKILQYLSLTHGKKVNEQSVSINIRLTQQDLAQLVGITRETAATELGKLKRRGIISYHGFVYTLHNDKLQTSRFADEWQTIHFSEDT